MHETWKENILRGKRSAELPVQTWVSCIWNINKIFLLRDMRKGMPVLPDTVFNSHTLDESGANHMADVPNSGLTLEAKKKERKILINIITR